MNTICWLSLGLFFALSAPAIAQVQEPPSPSSTPKEVLVGVNVLNIGKYDVGTGLFTVDFYLEFKNDPGIDPTRFEFINGRPKTQELIIDTPTDHFYRIQANLYTPPDLRQFPLDSQKLQIIIEDKMNTIDKLKYVPLLAETMLDENVHFTGWNLDSWKAYTRTHRYENWNEEFSQYVFEIEISRIAINAFLKTFLPVLFIVLIVYASFAMGPDQSSTRLGMTGSCLAAAVMFHVSIAKKIPSVGYLTFADKFMMLTYLITLASFMINVIIIAANQHGRNHWVNKINRFAEISMLILIPLSYVLLFLFQRP